MMRPAISSGLPNLATGICGRILESSTSFGIAIHLRVHRSPRTMNAAVPLPKHSPMRAGSFLAHGVQSLLAQHPLRLTKPRAVGKSYANPLGLRERWRGLDLDHPAGW